MVWDGIGSLRPPFIKGIDLDHVPVGELASFMEVRPDAFPLGRAWDDHLSMAMRPCNDRTPDGAVPLCGDTADDRVLQHGVGFGPTQDPLDPQRAVRHELDSFARAELLDLHVVAQWIRIGLQDDGTDLGKA
eukprot:scaffold2848_cov352-Pavlova_lutheri.AAC.5